MYWFTQLLHWNNRCRIDRGMDLFIADQDRTDFIVMVGVVAGTKLELMTRRHANLSKP